MLAAIDSNAILAGIALISAALATGRWVKNMVKRYMADRRADSSHEDQLWTAVFGRPKKPGYPEIVGLDTRVSNVETKVDVLLARTEANGGSSLRDLIVLLCQKNGITVPPVGESQKVPAELVDVSE
jgi:hypothetical protein